MVPKGLYSSFGTRAILLASLALIASNLVCAIPSFERMQSLLDLRFQDEKTGQKYRIRMDGPGNPLLGFLFSESDALADKLLSEYEFQSVEMHESSEHGPEGFLKIARDIRSQTAACDGTEISAEEKEYLESYQKCLRNMFFIKNRGLLPAGSHRVEISCVDKTSLFYLLNDNHMWMDESILLGLLLASEGLGPDDSITFKDIRSERGDIRKGRGGARNMRSGTRNVRDDAESVQGIRITFKDGVGVLKLEMSVASKGNRPGSDASKGNRLDLDANKRNRLDLDAEEVGKSEEEDPWDALKQILSFFRKCGRDKAYKEIISKKLEEGKNDLEPLLETPHFLLQSYFYEYFVIPEKYSDFLTKVFRFLSNSSFNESRYFKFANKNFIYVGTLDSNESAESESAQLPTPTPKSETGKGSVSSSEIGKGSVIQEQLVETSQEHLRQALFGQYFVPEQDFDENRLNEFASYCKALVKIQNKYYGIFPFSPLMKPIRPRKVPCYDRYDDFFLHNTFLNTTEACILPLLMALYFDESTGRYSVSKDAIAASKDSINDSSSNEYAMKLLASQAYCRYTARERIENANRLIKEMSQAMKGGVEMLKAADEVLLAADANEGSKFTELSGQVRKATSKLIEAADRFVENDIGSDHDSDTGDSSPHIDKLSTRRSELLEDSRMDTIDEFFLLYRDPQSFHQNSFAAVQSFNRLVQDLPDSAIRYTKIRKNRDKTKVLRNGIKGEVLNVLYAISYVSKKNSIRMEIIKLKEDVRKVTEEYEALMTKKVDEDKMESEIRVDKPKEPADKPKEPADKPKEFVDKPKESMKCTNEKTQENEKGCSADEDAKDPIQFLETEDTKDPIQFLEAAHEKIWKRIEELAIALFNGFCGNLFLERYNFALKNKQIKNENFYCDLVLERLLGNYKIEVRICEGESCVIYRNQEGGDEMDRNSKIDSDEMNRNNKSDGIRTVSARDTGVLRKAKNEISRLKNQLEAKKEGSILLNSFIRYLEHLAGF